MSEGVGVQIIGNKKRPLSDGWRWVRLGDHVTKVGSGITPLGGEAVYVQSGIPLIRSQNVHLNRFVPDGLVYITAAQDAEMEGSRVCLGDVLLNITGASIGRVCVVPSEICPANVNQHVSIVRCTPDLYPPFLSYYISTPDFQKFIMDTQAGATRQALTKTLVEDFQIPLPPLPEQQRIAAILNEQMAAVERARAAAEAQLEAAKVLPTAYIQRSFAVGGRQRISLEDCLEEVSNGVGSDWSSFRLVGATRGGIAPAKENLGKRPERYKLVTPGTIFYNPMRILLGSIAMIDEGEEAGITSPDYVVFKTREGRLSARWFYHWLRSKSGEVFVRSLARGAVRERMLFRRLVRGEIDLPPWNAQIEAAERMRDARRLEEMVRQHLSTINPLPAALLRRAFSGAR